METNEYGKLGQDLLQASTNLIQPRRQGRGRLLVLDLVTDQYFKTTGGGATVDWHVISGPLRLGEQVEDITAHVWAFNTDANFKYRVVARGSYDGVHWGSVPTVDLLSETVASDTYTIGTAVTDRTKFGRYIRLLLGLTDAGAVQEGHISISVAIKFWGQ